MLSTLGLTLVLGVVLVNGFTDAPSSIATAVCSGALKMKHATLVCAIFNFLGVVIASLLNNKIARFVFSLSADKNSSEAIAIVTLLSVIIFGIACYFLALPSSESHALICSAIGASFFATSSLDGIKRAGYVFVFMLISNFVALFASLISRRLLPPFLPYKRLQILSCSLTSFMHGWQDGQKLLGIALAIAMTGSDIPLYLIFLVAITMALGSLLGGKRIIKTMGNDLVLLNDFSAFCSDIGAYITLFIFSAFGAPLSTGNVKALAIVGAGIGDGKKINKKATAKVFLASVATFPICFLLGYLLLMLLCNIL